MKQSAQAPGPVAADGAEVGRLELRAQLLELGVGELEVGALRLDGAGGHVDRAVAVDLELLGDPGDPPGALVDDERAVRVGAGRRGLVVATAAGEGDRSGDRDRSSASLASWPSAEST